MSLTSFEQVSTLLTFEKWIKQNRDDYSSPSGTFNINSQTYEYQQEGTKYEIEYTVFSQSISDEIYTPHKMDTYIFASIFVDSLLSNFVILQKKTKIYCCFNLVRC